MIETDAWVLYEGPEHGATSFGPQDFRLEKYAFTEPGDGELLVEPLCGSWEGNMTHALERRPIDICRKRKEKRVVIGNSCVMRVLKPGPGVHGVREGDLGILYGGQILDEFGYTVLVQGYDAPGTIGTLAKRTKVLARNFLPIPRDSPFTMEQWAAFSVRYLTAWSNWQVAHGAYRLQIPAEDDPNPCVLGWGGGSTLASVDLARRAGCRTAMISGSAERLAEFARLEITGIDRRRFRAIEFDEQRYRSDPEYARQYLESERAFLEEVRDWSRGRNAAIVFDYIGAPVFRASLKALARQGVIATAGWLLGMQMTVNRAIECIGRHVHVHTHYIRHQDCREAMEYAVRERWMPEVTEVYPWEDVPALARDAAQGRLRSYFPVYRVNRV